MKSYLKQFFLVSAILVVISLMLGMLTQFKHIGYSSYDLYDAFSYVLMLTPRNFYRAMPFTLAISTIIFFQRLLVSNELVAIFQGISRMKLLSYSVVCIFIIVVTALLVGEF